MWWGRSDLIQFYNDGFIPILGTTKHPEFLGRSAAESWAEIWDIMHPMLEGVLSSGEATWSEDFLYVLNRNLPREEGYFTFSYSPLPDDTGTVAGIFCAVTETTGRVIGERRLQTLRDLGRSVMTAKTVEDACAVAAKTLSANSADLPFTLIYLVDEATRQARLAAITGLQAASKAAPEIIDLADKCAAWPLGDVLASGQPVLLSDLSARLGPLPAGPWPESAESALVLPIAGAGQSRPAGFMVAGLSPRRVIDGDYRSFCELVAGHVGTALTNARAYEEERKRAEALAELDRAKTTFFSNVSHEFRTPLTLMLGPLENLLAADETFAPEYREQINTAHRNSLRLLKLVNSLLDFSRIEAGRIKAAFAPVDLSSLTAELASNFRSAMESAGLALIVDCKPLPQPVYVDRDMWEKIVLNLLSNAFKFTFDGRVTVRLEPADTGAVLTVSDTGTGIPESELPHIFERFHRVENARGRTYEGTGIGLALIQELVKLHGGHIEASSRIGEGSVFTVTVPYGHAHLAKEHVLAAAAAASTVDRVDAYTNEALTWVARDRLIHATDQEIADATKPSEQRRRILLVDDNADMRDHVARILSDKYDLITAADGQAALEEIERTQPDLILSDVMMPRLDGFGLLRALRAKPRMLHVPFIMLSARAGEEARSEGMDAGADDYLIKPFSARELLTRIGAHLKLAKARQEASERERIAHDEAEALNEVSRVLGSELDIQKLVQTVTDAATKLTGAKFGAFFYNVMNEQGESYLLYALSGASREEFEKLGMMPRNTPIFDTTFSGRGSRRSADIRKDPDYGKMSPHFGMPKGHLPVCSYLAVPVKSRSGGVLGGLFFGHPEPGIFTDSSERLAEGIAVHAALAIDNARLFQRAEQEAHASTLLASIVDTSDDAIISKDLNGVITSWNASAERVFGYTAPEAIGQTVASLLVPADRQREEADILDRLQRGERVEHFETVRRRKDGTFLDVALTVSPIRDAGDKIIGASKIARDITELKRTERAIKSLNEQLRHDLIAMTRMQQLSTRLIEAQDVTKLLDEIISVAIDVTEADKGDIQLLENGLLRIAAYKGFEQPFLDFFNEVHDGQAACGAALRRGGRIVIEDVASSGFYDNIARKIMLDEQALAVQSTPLVTRSGEILGMLSTHYGRAGAILEGDLRWIDLLARQAADLIERRRAEQALRSSEELFRAAQTAAKVGVFDWDIRGGVNTWSAELEELYGLQPGSFSGTQAAWEELVHPEDRQNAVQRVEEAFNTGMPVEGEWRVIWPDRSIHWLAGRFQAHLDADGTPIRVSGVNFEITERKRIEDELRRANQDLEQFAYSASHDLQEPLRSVKIFSELLANRYAGKLDALGEEFLGNVRNSAQRMELLVRDLLAYTQASMTERTTELIDANTALQAALANLAGAITESGATIEHDSLPQVRIHAVQLAQVFQNIVSNALKYRRPGVAPAVRVTVRQENGTWIFSISDNGIGIEPEYKEKVFGLFKRLHTGDEYSGTGIGLALCQRIVERHHGRIWVESQPGKGSTFRFTLPQ